MPTIREVRESKGLSQQELASQIGVTIGTISHMELGRPTRRTTLTLVCQVLDISPDDVTGVVIANISNRVKRSV